jgi:hypothetical protein
LIVKFSPATSISRSIAPAGHAETTLRRRRAAYFAFVAALLALPGAASPGGGSGTKLTEQSTLADWKTADAEARSEVAVAIARKRLAADATRLEVATAAMEISGCLTATARDARFDAWQVEPTAKTCLEAPERPAKK